MKYSQIVLALYMFALVVFSPVQEFTYIENTVGAVLVGVFILETLFFSKKIYWHWSLNILVAFFFYALLTLLFNPEASRRFITFTLVLILGYTVFNVVGSDKNLKWMTSGLVMGIIYTMLFHFDQILALYNTNGAQRFGAGQNPNAFGLLLLVVILFLVRPLFKDKIILKSYIILGGILIVGSSYLILAATGSRKSVIVMSIIYIWTCFYITRDQSFGKKALMISIFAGLLVIIFLWYQNTVFYKRFERFYQAASGETVKAHSFHERMRMIYTGIQLWIQKPILGWGFDSFRFVSGFGKYGHNNFIELLVNTGFTGFVIYYSFYISIIYSTYKKYKQTVTLNKGILNWTLMILAVIIIWSVGAVTYYSKTNWILTGVALTALINTKSKVR